MMRCRSIAAVGDRDGPVIRTLEFFDSGGPIITDLAAIEGSSATTDAPVDRRIAAKDGFVWACASVGSQHRAGGGGALAEMAFSDPA